MSRSINNFVCLSGVVGLFALLSAAPACALSQSNVPLGGQERLYVSGKAVQDTGVSSSESKDVLVSVGGQPSDSSALLVEQSALPDESFSNNPVNLVAELSMGDARVKASGNGIVDIPTHAYTKQANMVPPTAIAQINLLLSENFRPYVGAGVNYTDVSQDDAVPKNINNKTVYQQNSFGSVFQIGADIDLSEHVFLNIDAKKLNKRFSGSASFVGNEGQLDPWVYGIGLGIKFK